MKEGSIKQSGFRVLSNEEITAVSGGFNSQQDFTGGGDSRGVNEVVTNAGLTTILSNQIATAVQTADGEITAIDNNNDGVFDVAWMQGLFGEWYRTTDGNFWFRDYGDLDDVAGPYDDIEKIRQL